MQKYFCKEYEDITGAIIKALNQDPQVKGLSPVSVHLKKTKNLELMLRYPNIEGHIFQPEALKNLVTLF